VLLWGHTSWVIHWGPDDNPKEKQLLSRDETFRTSLMSSQLLSPLSSKPSSDTNMIPPRFNTEIFQKTDAFILTVGMRMGNMLASTKTLRAASQRLMYLARLSLGVSKTP